ncbi:hypothetical protein THOM_0494 [Trachipleistophora hominis]|uniref:Uncharacterized protein n=1 Tax=Trachipleistophora hominis TaxID=72359 RepID=L7JYC2_TRAHO|nr:hypothetical protein THOM_0494 [Trachipleistophora hominis]
MFLFTLYCVISCNSPKSEETGESSGSEAIINQQNVKVNKRLKKFSRRVNKSPHQLSISSPSQAYTLKSCEHGTNKSGGEGYNLDMSNLANFYTSSKPTSSKQISFLPSVDNTRESGTQQRRLDYFSLRRNGIACDDNQTFYSDGSEADYKMTFAKRRKRSMHDTSNNIDKPLIVLTNGESMSKKKFDQGNGKTKNEE